MTQQVEGSEFELVLRAAAFAADKHRLQKRKDVEESPYINHPLDLAQTLASRARVSDPEVLAAALLHDTVEDTETTIEELDTHFGGRVAAIVAEVTDNKTLPKAERKRLQIEKGPQKSSEAKLVKLADKICNLRDILACPPADWPRSQKLEYFEWAARVVDGMRGVSRPLEEEFDRLHELGVREFASAAA